MATLSFLAHGQRLLIIEGDSLVCISPNQLRIANNLYLSYSECKEKEENLTLTVENLESLVMSKSVEINLCDSLRMNLEQQVELRLEQNTILNDKIKVLEKDKKKLKTELWVTRIATGVAVVLALLI